jgi:FixJ family two-component response regulator
MISSLSHKEKVEEALAAGAKYFIAKPVTTGDLRKAIEQVLTHKDDRRPEESK